MERAPTPNLKEIILKRDELLATKLESAIKELKAQEGDYNNCTDAGTVEPLMVILKEMIAYPDLSETEKTVVSLLKQVVYDYDTETITEITKMKAIVAHENLQSAKNFDIEFIEENFRQHLIEDDKFLEK